MLREDFEMLVILWYYADAMRAAAGWRENDIMDRAERMGITRAGHAAIITVDAAEDDDDGHRDTAAYHTGRHGWIG